MVERSDTTGFSTNKRVRTPEGVPADSFCPRHNSTRLASLQDAFHVGLVTGGVAALNHRLLAVMPPASTTSRRERCVYVMGEIHGEAADPFTGIASVGYSRAPPAREQRFSRTLDTFRS